MQRSTQEKLADQIRGHLRTGSTDLADEVFRNPTVEYVDPDHLRRELGDLFANAPVVVAHASELALPNDFIAVDVAGVPLLVVRQSDGTVGAFLNVCRHRGSKVTTEPCGHSTVFTCPYHAWSYRPNGDLFHVPHSGDFGAISRENYALVALPAEERHGLVWVTLTAGRSVDVAAFLGPDLDDELTSYGIDCFTAERTHRVDVATNWKVIIDGFLETYHLGVLHRTTIGPHIRTNLAPFRTFGPHGCMTAVRTSFDRAGPDTDDDPGPHLVNAYQIFPNTVLVWSGMHFEAWTAFPRVDNPGTSDVTVRVLGRPDHLAEATDYWDRNWDVVTSTVLGEDFTVGTSIQQGFAAGAQTHVTFGRNEPGVQHFHRSLREALASAQPVSED